MGPLAHLLGIWVFRKSVQGSIRMVGLDKITTHRRFELIDYYYRVQPAHFVSEQTKILLTFRQVGQECTSSFQNLCPILFLLDPPRGAYMYTRMFVYVCLYIYFLLLGMREWSTSGYWLHFGFQKTGTRRWLCLLLGLRWGEEKLGEGSGREEAVTRDRKSEHWPMR